MQSLPSTNVRVDVPSVLVDFLQSEGVVVTGVAITGNTTI